MSWRLCISLAQIYFHSPNTVTERFRVSVSVKRSVLFFRSSEWMCSAPVFDVPQALVWSARLAVTLLFSHTQRERERERETGRHRQTWLPPEQRLCSHCDLNQMETELHFLTECSKYTDIRTVFYNKIQQIHPTFKTLPDQEKLAYLLGEHKTCCVFAAQYVSLCHHRREDTPPALSWCSQHI